VGWEVITSKEVGYRQRFLRRLRRNALRLALFGAPIFPHLTVDFLFFLFIINHLLS
jgi:hypothetical protein